jgi:hypothetical protein
MKTLKQFKESCWKGYTAIGVKKKGNRTVPNCVPVKEDGGMIAVAGPANVISSGSIAGSGGRGGEPGVSKKRKPIMMGMGKRNPPQ